MKSIFTCYSSSNGRFLECCQTQDSNLSWDEVHQFWHVWLRLLSLCGRWQISDAPWWRWGSFVYINIFFVSKSKISLLIWTWLNFFLGARKSHCKELSENLKFSIFIHLPNFKIVVKAQKKSGHDSVCYNEKKSKKEKKTKADLIKILKPFYLYSLIWKM